MFRACHAHHQEKQSVLVASFTPNQHTTLPPTRSDNYHEAVLIQSVSPDDEHDMLETCREL